MIDQDSEKPEQHPETPFTPEDIAQFDADDARAGRAVGKMLTIVFCYTVVATSIAAYYTWCIVSQ